MDNKVIQFSYNPVTKEARLLNIDGEVLLTINKLEAMFIANQILHNFDFRIENN